MAKRVERVVKVLDTERLDQVIRNLRSGYTYQITLDITLDRSRNLLAAQQQFFDKEDIYKDGDPIEIVRRKKVLELREVVLLSTESE